MNKFALSWVTAEIAVFPSARSVAEGVSRGAAGAHHPTRLAASQTRPAAAGVCAVCSSTR